MRAGRSKNSSITKDAIREFAIGRSAGGRVARIIERRNRGYLT